MPPIQISAQDLTIFSVIIIPMMLKLALITVLLISWQACSAETLPEGQFSVSVVSSSGKPVDAPQVYLVTKEGIFQEGVPGKDGLFIFKTPDKSAFLFAAAPGFEGTKITYNGQKTVSITMKDSDTRSSAIDNPSLTLEGVWGTQQARPSSAAARFSFAS